MSRFAPGPVGSNLPTKAGGALFMAWIESHQELRNHPKLSAVCRTLSAKRVEVIGALHCLWWWCMDYAMEGDISRFNAQQIADASDWKGDAKVFCQALIDANFIDRGDDGSTKIHDWMDFCGELIIKRLRRKDEKRRKTADIVRRNPPKSAEMSPTRPYRTLPNHTTTTQAKTRTVFLPPTPDQATTYARSIAFELDGSAFCDYYQARGWEYKKGQKMKDWKAAVRLWMRNQHNDPAPTAAKEVIR